LKVGKRLKSLIQQAITKLK